MWVVYEMSGTADGKSHSCVIPTTLCCRPSDVQISVVDGRRDAMRSFCCSIEIMVMCPVHNIKCERGVSWLDSMMSLARHFYPPHVVFSVIPSATTIMTKHAIFVAACCIYTVHVTEEDT